MNITSSIRLFVLGTVASLALVTNLRAQPFGQWDFKSGDLSATVGSSALTADGDTLAGTVFNTTTFFGLPPIDGVATNVMKYPGSTNALMGYVMPTPPANGGMVNVDNYTLILDVLFPYEEGTKLRPILQTDGGLVTAAADFAINANGQIGSPGVGFGGFITTNTWYRIGFVVRTNQLKTYIDGAEIDTLNGAINRYPLFPNDSAELLANRIAGSYGGGYVASIQLRAAALTAREMRAMGKATATGIPQTVPPVPSFVNNWIPATAVAERTNSVGVVIDEGDTTIDLNSISLTYDGVLLPNVTKSQVGDVITVKTNMGTLALGEHELVLTYTDDAVGVQSVTNVFKAVLFYEDFDSLVLGPNVQEDCENPNPSAFTKTPPAGWVLDDSQMPGFGNPALNGVDEWAGWSWASRAFWFAADAQNREFFEKAKGTVMIADPDEWDDGECSGGDHAVGYFNSFVKTRTISLEGVPANSVYVKFDSSWRDEAFDDCGGTEWPACPATNNQTATIRVQYNGVGAWIQKLKWDSNPNSPTFHDDGPAGTDTVNETVTIVIDNPVGATNVLIEFGLSNAGNDWWWAVDNLQVGAGPAITTQPVSILRDAGTLASFTVVAAGSGTVNYQWQYSPSAGGTYTNLPGATSATHSFTAETNNAGSYRVLVTDDIDTTPSSAASLTVIAAPLISQQPASQTVNAGVDVRFDATARGRAPVSYQWAKGGSPLTGETGSSLAIRNAQSGNAGAYTCVISNASGVVTSRVANLKVTTSITTDLVLHLKFDNNYSDSSGRGNNATAVGSPTFVAGQIGSGAMQWTSPREGGEFSYATLGAPSDLLFTDNTPFSASFWLKLTPGQRSGDPAIIGNKNWNSGNNCGFVIFTTGPLRFNYRELDVADPNPLLSQLNSRKDGNPGTTPPAGINMEDGNWHHCVVTFNRGGNAGIYVDGQLRQIVPLQTANATVGGNFAPTTIDAVPVNARSAGATAINIGQDGVGSYTDGNSVGLTNAVIDDVGIWRRTLTPGEVAAIYAAGLAGNSLDTAAPVTNPRPLDPTVTVVGSEVEVQKANAALLGAGSLAGPWSVITGALGTNKFVEPATSTRYYRGGQP